MNSIKLLWVLLILSSTACKQHENNDIFIIPSEVRDHFNVDTIYLIPRAGCTGCINDATTTALKNINNTKNTKIVFTGIEGKKELKILLGENIRNPNIFLDTANIFFTLYDKNSIYPHKLIKKEKNIFIRTSIQK